MLGSFWFWLALAFFNLFFYFINTDLGNDGFAVFNILILLLCWWNAYKCNKEKGLEDGE